MALLQGALRRQNCQALRHVDNRVAVGTIIPFMGL
jgi:hypothetical protein